MELFIERQNETLAVHLHGEIDHHSAASARREIDEAYAKARPRELVLDFAGVTFMDSSGIGLVMGRYRLTASSGTRLRVVGAGGSVGKMMQIAGLGKLIPIEQKER